MNSLRLDDNFDLVIENNSLVPIDGREAIKQHMRCRFGIFQGEFIYDTSVGVTWRDEILTKFPSITVVNDILKSTILDTPGCTGLESFDFSYDSSMRKGILTFMADSVAGLIDFSGAVPGAA